MLRVLFFVMSLLALLAMSEAGCSQDWSDSRSCGATCDSIDSCRRSRNNKAYQGYNVWGCDPKKYGGKKYWWSKRDGQC
ncbi:uncharacterized protein VTP21DRAFT_10269 [Calcarisporiella thermophila]|uniref:uncharacterized protein n=1 Tax=Calcarisporiella thermophila TaxID=911321 RepID=UPI00374489B7